MCVTAVRSFHHLHTVKCQCGKRRDGAPYRICWSFLPWQFFARWWWQKEQIRSNQGDEKGRENFLNQFSRTHRKTKIDWSGCPRQDQMDTLLVKNTMVQWYYKYNVNDRHMPKHDTVKHWRFSVDGNEANRNLRKKKKNLWVVWVCLKVISLCQKQVPAKIGLQKKTTESSPPHSRIAACEFRTIGSRIRQHAAGDVGTRIILSQLKGIFQVLMIFLVSRPFLRMWECQQ